MPWSRMVCLMNRRRDSDGVDETTSMCVECGYIPGMFLPGIPCPECGEPMV